jgi:hypothetical protein
MVKTAALSGAERARRYRERHGDLARKKDAQRKADERAADSPELRKKWNQRLADENLKISRGLILKDAPSGCGLLVTGGYDATKVSQIAQFQDDKPANSGAYIGGGYHARRGGTEGHSAKADDNGGKIVGTSKGAVYVEDRPSSFKVEMGVHKFQSIVEDLVREMFDENDNDLACAECNTTVEWRSDRPKHIEDVHGDLVDRIYKNREREQRKQENAAKKAARLRNEQQLAELRRQAKREGWGKK